MTRYDLAYQLGSYKAIAEMMAQQIRQLRSADNEFDRAYITTRLEMLADQYDAAVARHAAKKAAA